MRRLALQSALLGLLFSLSLWPSSGRQQKSQSGNQSSNQSGDQSSGQSGESSSRHPEAEQSQAAPRNAAYDPVPAQHDIDVGMFYIHKGDLDAAIARFQDAIRLKSNFAKPRLLLGQAYEKKGDKATAAKYYKEYLQVLPGAPDARKIRKKIEELTAR
ncbi:MAG TPA: tetratricopeptide repeat protein [Candidatus Acidoferrales bacterium]|nr:tetratricopeptide repeat protein [Candidatus Acidoferrales bacterium]